MPMLEKRNLSLVSDCMRMAKRASRIDSLTVHLFGKNYILQMYTNFPKAIILAN